MLNIVADKEGVGAAVLVRSCAPINGKKLPPEVEFSYLLTLYAIFVQVLILYCKNIICGT